MKRLGTPPTRRIKEQVGGRIGPSVDMHPMGSRTILRTRSRLGFPPKSMHTPSDMDPTHKALAPQWALLSTAVEDTTYTSIPIPRPKE
ncbi:hypothetical protein IMZ48_08245 [Candidatus Bathyarchaeota archaeon]|nr:hypothetical protein [Candidatus Bathyarchaeota archaeon]